MEGKQVGHGTSCRRILSEIIGVTSNGSQVSMLQSKSTDLTIFSFLDCPAMLSREWLLQLFMLIIADNRSEHQNCEESMSDFFRQSMIVNGKV